MNLLAFLVCSILATNSVSQDIVRQGFHFTRDDEGHIHTVRYSGSSGLRCAQLHKLPNLETVEIEYGTHLTEDDVTYLSTLTRLTGLEIGGEIVDNAVTIEGELTKLGGMKSLEWVKICIADIRDGDLKFVALLPEIRYLEFNSVNVNHGVGGPTPITDECATHLCRAKKLESIRVMGEGTLSDEFVSKLSEGLPGLRHLDMGGTGLTDESLRQLAAHCKELDWLVMMSNRFTDGGVAHLSQVSSLEMLWLESNALTDKCIAAVAPLKRLKHLELTVPTISTESIRVLAGLQQLEIFALRKPPITDEQFSTFREHPTLESAFLNGARLTEKGTVKIIKTLPKLSRLNVGWNNKSLQAAVDLALAQKAVTRNTKN